MPKKGHWKGADAVENLLDWCEEFDIKIVTLYALSAENLDRDDDELEYLYELIRMRLEKLYNDPRIHRSKMRVKGIGRIELLPESIKEVLKRLDDATKDYDNHFLNIALAYGGQNELVDAVKKIGGKIKEGSLDVNDIDKNEIESNSRPVRPGGTHSVGRTPEHDGTRSLSTLYAIRSARSRLARPGDREGPSVVQRRSS